MLRGALLFFVVALIAAVFGFLGIAAVAVPLPRLCFLFFWSYFWLRSSADYCRERDGLNIRFET